jgi:hypothetical protein
MSDSEAGVFPLHGMDEVMGEIGGVVDFAQDGGSDWSILFVKSIYSEHHRLALDGHRIQIHTCVLIPSGKKHGSQHGRIQESNWVRLPVNSARRFTVAMPVPWADTDMETSVLSSAVGNSV